MASRKSDHESQRNCLGADSVTEPGCDVGSDLHREPEQIFEIKVETCEVKEASTVVHIDEDIDIAVGTRLASCHRTVHAKVRCSVSSNGGENLRPYPSEQFQTWRIVGRLSCCHVLDCTREIPFSRTPSRSGRPPNIGVLRPGRYTTGAQRSTPGFDPLVMSPTIARRECQRQHVMGGRGDRGQPSNQ